MKDVTLFHERLKLQNIVDLETLIKGAKIANEPYNYALFGLSVPEYKTISTEGSQSFWKTRGLLVTIMATACAAITQFVHNASGFRGLF